MAATSAFLEVFADVDPTLRAIGERLEQGILAAHPASTVVAYPGYASVNYGFGPKKNTEGYAYIMALKNRVNIGFYQGAGLSDPDGLLEGSGKTLRHVKVGDVDAAARKAVAGLIAASVEECRLALGVEM